MPRSAVYSIVCLLILGAVFVCYVAVRSYWGERSDYVRTPSTAMSKQPLLARIAHLEEISFSSPGDPPLAAWYAPPAATRAAVVLVHGVDADRSSLVFESRVLARAGFGILALDLPGQGASGGRTEWGLPERRAISAAVEWLTHRAEVDPQRIGAFGMSMGAYVLAQAAVTDKRIAAVVLAATPNDVVEFNWQASSRWGLLSQYPTYWALRAAGTPIDFVPKDIVGEIAPRPVLFVQGDLDGLVPEWMARQLFAAAREPKELYIVKGAHHADYSHASPLEYQSRLTEFYARSLTRPSGPSIDGYIPAVNFLR